MRKSTFDDHRILHDIDSGIGFKLGKYDFYRREYRNDITGQIDRVSVEAEGFLEFKSSALKYHVNITSPLYSHQRTFIQDVYMIDVTLSQNDRFRMFTHSNITRELLRDAIDTSGNIFLHIIGELEHKLRLFLIEEILSDVQGVDDIVIDFLSKKLGVEKSNMAYSIYNSRHLKWILLV